MFKHHSVKLSLLCGVATLVIASIAYSEIRAKVFINEIPSPVYFNDGDSFRVLSGKLNGTKARLSGYNTLESFGPVHRWGDWHAKELYFNAKIATQNAAKGVWSCDFGGDRDGYGRGLFWCKDLAADQIRKGLAHAMTVDGASADPYLLEAQAEAIREKRGMWAKGIPDYVMTSLHSKSERPGKDYVYNRLVSTKDGHSEKWLHTEVYDECQWVCANRVTVDPEVSKAGIAALRVAEELKPWEYANGYSDAQLAHAIDIWLRIQSVTTRVEKDHVKDFRAALKRLADEGVIKAATTEVDSCALFVEFKRRYGTGRAKCLK